MSNEPMSDWAGTLVVMRHGQSVFNAQDRYTGHEDAPLSPRGEQEARRAGVLLASSGLGRFDHAFSSRLQRARRTLELAMEAGGVVAGHAVQAARLNERHYGDLQGMTVDEATDRWGEEAVRSYQRDMDSVPPGVDGESLRMMADRVGAWFHEVAYAKLVAGESVLLAAHGGTLRMLMVRLGLVGEQEAFRFPTAVPAVVCKEGPRFMGDRASLAASMMTSGRT
ncbi:MAG: 2,3-bisphosphoglycerate-dependent phosphoglycerate mutase [Planctomycetota bacterium]